MADHLTKINGSDLCKLSELYAAKSGGDKIFYVSYMTIETFIRWFQQDPNLKHVDFYCLNGDFSDGTFIVTDRYTAYADTLNTSHDNLSRLLQLLDYSKGYLFWSIRHEVHPTIVNALNKIGARIQEDDETLLYRLPKEKALEFKSNSAPGIRLKPIVNQQDLEKVNSLWSDRCRNSFILFERLAKYNPNIGAFTDDGTLVSWSFRSPTGLVAGLRTDEQYLGKGYGLLVVKEVSKAIAQLGHDVYSDIFESKRPSRGLFEKLGFEVVSKVHWINTKHNWTEADE